MVALAIIAVAVGLTGIASGQTISSPMDGQTPTLNKGIPKDVQDVKVEQRLGNQVSSKLRLTNADGAKIKTGDFFDGSKPVIVTLNYSNCPMLCNVQLNQLVISLQQLDLRLGEDFRMLSVSIDPTEPTSKIRETKTKYVDLLPAQPGAEEGWAFCTADQPVITELARTFGFQYNYDPDTKEFYHPAMLAFVSPDGVITRYSLGVDFPTEQLRLSLLEAGKGTVGTAVDQVLLWCYSYDPEKNRYVSQAWVMMRVGGAATVLAVLGCLIPFWIGNKGQPQSATETEQTSGTPDQSAATTEQENT